MYLLAAMKRFVDYQTARIQEGNGSEPVPEAGRELGLHFSSLPRVQVSHSLVLEFARTCVPGGVREIF
jgi:hypothetical protein